MNIIEQIQQNINCQPEPKRTEMEALHQHILQLKPDCKLWFDNGLNDQQKAVTNPTIGYGEFRIKYANGKTKDFFQIGLCSNATGFSVYILGLDDKEYLAKTYGNLIGKAKVTGYCIRFKSLKDIQLEVLLDAIRYGFNHSGLND